MAPSKRAWLAVLLAFGLVALAHRTAHAATSPATGSWLWPIEGRIARGFAPPTTPFSAGHRGIDIDAAFGTPVRAPANGVVSFTGFVAGELFVTIDHGDGYRSTDSWLGQSLVKKGQAVKAGDVVALSGRGHPELPEDQLHFGVRLGDNYIDPLTVLGPQSAVDLVRLVPLDSSPSSSAQISASPPPGSFAWFSAPWTSGGPGPMPSTPTVRSTLRTTGRSPPRVS